VVNGLELLKMALTEQFDLLAYFCPRGHYQMEEKRIKPFKLRRPVVLGAGPLGITITWRVWLAFCTMVVIIVVGVVSWFHPWFGLP
jgi:hypothetical protein